MAKDVALALSSGGARGFAHIGAIEELEARGDCITSIAGCSMESLIAGVYAAGKLEEFREWTKSIDRKRVATAALTTTNRKNSSSSAAKRPSRHLTNNTVVNNNRKIYYHRISVISVI